MAEKTTTPSKNQRSYLLIEESSTLFSKNRVLDRSFGR